MPKRKKTILTLDQTQQALLVDLKARLASCGHLVVRVSKHKRQHISDFLAIPKDNPQQFLLVQPIEAGRVRIRPFCCPGLYVKVKKVVRDAQKSHKRKVHWGDQIPLKRRNYRLRHFLTPAGEKELTKIIGTLP